MIDLAKRRSHDLQEPAVDECECGLVGPGNRYRHSLAIAPVVDVGG
ncbi:hypothetical protein BH24ACT9_BH24ACT9_11220 [soil metagenome]